MGPAVNIGNIPRSFDEETTKHAIDFVSFMARLSFLNTTSLFGRLKVIPHQSGINRLEVQEKIYCTLMLSAVVC